jgi:hypothetical protein
MHVWKKKIILCRARKGVEHFNHYTEQKPETLIT